MPSWSDAGIGVAMFIVLFGPLLVWAVRAWLRHERELAQRLASGGSTAREVRW